MHKCTWHCTSCSSKITQRDDDKQIITLRLIATVE